MTESRKAYPTILQVFGLLGIYLGLAVIFALFLLPVLKFDEQLFGTFTFISYVVPMFILCLFAIKNTTWNWREIFGTSEGNDPITYLLLLALVISNTFIVDPILSFFPMPEAMEEIFKEMVKPNVGSFITVVFAAALFEEYLFRGIILKGFLRNYRPQKAIIWSAALFGLFHFNPWQFVAAGVIGLYMGWIYYRTRSLWPCMFIHFVNNLLSWVIFMIYGQEDMTIYDFSENIPIALMSIVAGLIAVYLLFVVLDRRLPAAPEDQNMESYDA